MQTKAVERRAFSIEETAAQLGVGVCTVRRWLADGTLHFVQVPGRRRILIPKMEIDRLLSGFKQPGAVR